jgi:hypothetical protein
MSVGTAALQLLVLQGCVVLMDFVWEGEERMIVYMRVWLVSYHMQPQTQT